MTVAVDISMYPLTQAYEEPIKAFIRELRSQPGLTVATNPLTTQLSGDYDAVMDGLKAAMRPVLSGTEAVSFVVKILNVEIVPGKRVEIS